MFDEYIKNGIKALFYERAQYEGIILLNDRPSFTRNIRHSTVSIDVRSYKEKKIGKFEEKKKEFILKNQFFFKIFYRRFVHFSNRNLFN